MFCIKKVCTYLISWTYADKLHTLKCIIYFHNVRQHAHKKTSNKTGFTLVCHSFISYYIFLFKKCQTKIFLHFFSFMHCNRHEIKKPSRLLKREITRNSLSSPISRLFFLLIQSLYNIVESVFVAKLSETALTAASLVYSIQFLMIAVGVGTAVGLNALLSRKIGQHKAEEAWQDVADIYRVGLPTIIIQAIGSIMTFVVNSMLLSNSGIKKAGIYPSFLLSDIFK